MPRKPRFYLPGISAHVLQRGQSREAVFYEDADYNAYLGWLSEAAGRYHCAIHAYVLMTNHVHILVTPSDGEGISRMMQYVGRLCALHQLQLRYQRHDLGRAVQGKSGTGRGLSFDLHALYRTKSSPR